MSEEDFSKGSNRTDSGSEEDGILNLGSKIELSGFRDIDRASMVIIKKITGSYLKRYDEISQNIEKLQIYLKPVHTTEASQKYEVHAKLIDNGSVKTSEHTDRNLFIVMDKVLNSIEQEITK